MFNKENKKAQATARAGQAAIELAVFGAILIFILGSIIRSSVNNSLEQNVNFKAMRMALLSSWKDSQNQLTAHNQATILYIEDRISPDASKYGSIDRTPLIAQGSGSFTYMLMYPIDPNSVGSNLPVMDVYINGQHFPLTTASYVPLRQLTPNMTCPMGQGQVENSAGTVIVAGQTPLDPAAGQAACLQICSTGDPSTQDICEQGCAQQAQLQCKENQCLRYNREWVNGSVNEGQFQGILPTTLTNTSVTMINGAPTSTLCSSLAATATQSQAAVQGACQDQFNAFVLFNQLVCDGLLAVPSASTWPSINCGASIPEGVSTTLPITATVTAAFPATFTGAFTTWFNNNYLGQSSGLTSIQTVLQGTYQYKLLYTLIANNGTPGTGVDQFSVTPPTCVSHPCMDQELSSDIQTTNNNGVMGYWNGIDPVTKVDHSGDMMYDLMRNANYDYPAGGTDAVESPSRFYNPVPAGTTGVCSLVSTANPPPSTAANSLRCNISWQWAATAAIDNNQQSTSLGIGIFGLNQGGFSFTLDGTDPMLGLDAGNGQYPSYDVDGRLKLSTIYGILQGGTSGATYPWIAYMDSQGGDIDTTWDSNSCTPKPGLQAAAQIFTFTKNGTYLLIKEGKLYNPETHLYVRSINQGDNVDLIQRSFQLTKNTGRFCDGVDETPRACIARCMNLIGCARCGINENDPNYSQYPGYPFPQTEFWDYQTTCCVGTRGKGGSCQACWPNETLPKCSLVGIDPAPNNCCVPTEANFYCGCDPSAPSFSASSRYGMEDSCTQQPGEQIPPYPNPVEACVPPNDTGVNNNCFTTANIAKTCLDENSNILYVRSRLENRRGHFWMTDTSGQLKVQ